jgi:hypothetical protein
VSTVCDKPDVSLSQNALKAHAAVQEKGHLPVIPVLDNISRFIADDAVFEDTISLTVRADISIRSKKGWVGTTRIAYVCNVACPGVAKTEDQKLKGIIQRDDTHGVLCVAPAIILSQCVIRFPFPFSHHFPEFPGTQGGPPKDFLLCQVCFY